MPGQTFHLTVVKGRRDMVRLAPLVLVVAALSACGDLSQEDLLFRAAVPAKDIVALTVPGVPDDGGDDDGQALSACADGDLRCTASEIARGFNGLTFTLLDVVDAVVTLPPSRREPGRRVWGPHFDLEKGRSFRFEMVRQPLSEGGDGGTYTFCLHDAAGRVSDDEVADLDCGSADDVMQNIFSGAFQPSDVAGDGARLGKGTLRFEAEKVQRVDGGDRFARALDFAFDNTADEVHIDVVASGVPVVADIERDAGYSFDKDADGAGRFQFEFFTDLVSDGRLIPAPNPEHVTLTARWRADQAGRATGVVDGGDLDAGQVGLVDQCWDADLTITRLQGVDGVVTGPEDDDVCVFEAADLDG
jgi:hypothetical protein